LRNTRSLRITLLSLKDFLELVNLFENCRNCKKTVIILKSFKRTKKGRKKESLPVQGIEPGPPG